MMSQRGGSGKIVSGSGPTSRHNPFSASHRAVLHRRRLSCHPAKIFRAAVVAPLSSRHLHADALRQEIKAMLRSRTDSEGNVFTTGCFFQSMEKTYRLLTDV